MNKINFTNLPSTTTPVNATNLNAVQTNVENAINSVSARDDYTTTEQVVGTWTDSKPLYRKVLKYDRPDLNSYISHNIANIENIVLVRMMLKEGNSTYKELPIVYQESDSILPRFCISLYAFTQTQFLLASGSYYVENKNNLALTVVVEYTKTTD